MATEKYATDDMYDNVNDEYIELSDAQKEYIRIYHAYFVLNWEIHEICEHFQKARPTIFNAIKWVVDNKLKFAPEQLLEGAIFAIRERMKTNKELLDNEKIEDKPDKKFMIALMQMLQTDEDRVFKLQQIISPTAIDKDDKISASDVLKLISAAK